MSLAADGSPCIQRFLVRTIGCTQVSSHAGVPTSGDGEGLGSRMTTEPSPVLLNDCSSRMACESKVGSGVSARSVFARFRSGGGMHFAHPEASGVPALQTQRAASHSRRARKHGHAIVAQSFVHLQP